MNHREFLAAFGAMKLAIEMPEGKKPKSFSHATEAYRRGTKGKREHIEELQNMTILELYELSYKLYQEPTP